MAGNAAIDTCSIINFKHINRFDLLERLKYNAFTTIYVILEINNCRVETKSYFEKLMQKNKISHVSLSIEDLIEMSNVPESRKISDAELSCFVKAKNIGCITVCDDSTAVKYAKRFISLGTVLGIKEILIEAYVENLLGDYEIKQYQQTLEENKFKIKGDLLFEAASCKYIKGTAIAGNNN